MKPLPLANSSARPPVSHTAPSTTGPLPYQATVPRDIGSDVPRFLSRASCRAIIAQMHQLGLVHGQADLESQWRGTVRWARNRVSIATDWRDNTAQCLQEHLSFNQIDLASLHGIVESAQRDFRSFPTQKEIYGPKALTWNSDRQVYPETHIWSDSTYTQTAASRAVIADQLIAGSEQAGMLSAGFLSAEARGTTVYLADGTLLYAPQTLAQCSMTVRDPQGTGSGWAGCSSYDWDRFDASKLAAIALDKCLRSRNPVRIEPGRYTLIMEPQATFDFADAIMNGGMPKFMDRKETEYPRFVMPFVKGMYVHSSPPAGIGNGNNATAHRLGIDTFDPTRIGERVLDERISISFDPVNPDLGVIPFDRNSGEPVGPVTWFDKGVLTDLFYDRDYAMDVLLQSNGKLNSGSFLMSGGATTIDEMIATTKRGLIVTRFWGLSLVDQGSILFSGLTRDGLWLIENGKISHPVKNMRFTESPLFAFNQVEQLGVPVPVFHPEIPAIAPPIKVRDFSFTSLVDAV